MEIRGTVVRNIGIESGTSKSGKAWSKASVLISTEGMYPKPLLLTNFKEAAQFARLAPGESGTFHIDVETREWTNPNTGRTSWFTEVTCWKWEIGTAQQPQMQQPVQQPAMQTMQPQMQAQQQPPQQTDWMSAFPPQPSYPQQQQQVSDLPF